MNDTGAMSIDGLIKALSSDANADDENIGIVTFPAAKLQQCVLKCLGCSKEFDSSQINASISLCLCSHCNASVKTKNFSDIDEEDANESDDEHSGERAPPNHQSIYAQGEIPDYTGFSTAKDLAEHFLLQK